MRPHLPLCCTLVLAACLKEPSNGTFVGNPGTLQLTAARTSGFVTDAGASTLGALDVLPCDDGQQEAVDLGGVQVSFDGKAFTTDPPVQIPEGTWCGLELRLDALSFDVRSESTETVFLLDFEDIVVRVTGPELVIEGQTFALELARRDWLSILEEDAAGIGGDPVQVREALPDTWEQLRLVLTNASALSFVSDPNEPPSGNVTEDGSPTDPQQTVLWGGADRPPTEPTTTQTTPTPLTPAFSVTTERFLPAVNGIDGSQRPSVAFSNDTVAIVMGDYDQGISAVVTNVYDDAQYGDGQTIQRQGTYDPHVSGTPNGDFQLISADASTIYVGQLSEQAELIEGTPIAAANASYPTTSGADDGLIAWLQADTLRIKGTDDPTQGTILAEGVRGRFSMASGADQQLAVAWVEDLPNPLTGGVSERLYVAVFSNDGTTQLLPIGASQPSDPRVSLGSDHIAVAYDDGGQGLVDVFAPSGVWLATMPLPPEARSVDVQSVGDTLVVAYVDEQAIRVQLFSSDGQALSEAVQTGLMAEQLDLAVSATAGGSTPDAFLIAVAASLPTPEGMAALMRAELQPGR